MISFGCANAQECDEELGKKLIQEQIYEGAFHALHQCEFSESASAQALFALAYLYLDEDIPGLGSTRERELKTWDLMEKAALTGDEDAVVSLAGMYNNGDPGLGFNPEPEVGTCLLGLTDSDADLESNGLMKREAVMRCLAIPSESPIGEQPLTSD